MLFSQARGKVGDLVFSRLDGEQIVRSRNRHPKNPKTNAQLYQRAIMATVLRAYSAGKVIFDHAFEGKQVGAQNQRTFLSLNAKRLRAAIAADIAASAVGSGCSARVVGPGVPYPVAGRYQVSEGSLSQEIFDNAGKLIGTEDVSGELVSEYLARKGFTQDDIFTLIVFENTNASVADNVVFSVNGAHDVFARQTTCHFAFLRLRVKASAFSLGTPMTDAVKLSHIFEVDLASSISLDLSDFSIYDALTSPDYTDFSYNLITSGVIRSKENTDLRSTCILDWNEDYVGQYGISSDYLLTAWSQGTQALGDSDLILEGGDSDFDVTNSGATVTVPNSAGVPVTLVGIVPGDDTASEGMKYAMLKANDGTLYYLFCNVSRSLAYGKLMYIRNSNGVMGWGGDDTEHTKTPYINLAEEDGLTMDDAFIDWLLAQGISVNKLFPLE